MKDPKFLLVAVIVVACATGAQSNFWNDVQSSFQGATQGAGDWFNNFGADAKKAFTQGWGKIKDYKDKALSKMKNIPEVVREHLKTGNMRDLDPDRLLEIPREGWFNMNPQLLMSMGRENLTRLITQGDGKIPEGVLQELKDMQLSNITKEEAIGALRTQNCPLGQKGPSCSVSKTVLRAYQAKLGDPKKLTDKNITALGKDGVVNLPPSFLAQITNKDALQKIADYYQNCVDSPSFRCPPKEMSQRLVDRFTRKAKGNPNTWSQETITEMGGLARMDPKIISRLSDKTIKDVEQELRNMDFNEIDGRRILRRLLKMHNVFNKNIQETVDWVKGLGKLQKFLLPTDVKDNVRENAEVQKILQDNGKRMAGENILPPRSARILLKESFKGKNAYNMTESEVNGLGATLKYAAPKVLEKLVNNRTLRGNTARAIGEVTHGSTPGSQAKARIMSKALMKESSINNMPPNLIAFLSPDQIRSMGETLAIRVFEGVTEDVRWKELNDGQRLTIMSRVSDKTRVPPQLRSELSTFDYSGMSVNQMKAMAKDMPCSSQFSIMSAQKVFGNKKTISDSDIAANKEQAACMSPFDAMKIKDDEIMQVLQSFNENPVPPSFDVCHILKDKLLKFAMKDRGVENAEQFAMTLTPLDLEGIPPCVILALGPEAIRNIPPGMKQELLEDLAMKDNSRCTRKKARELLVSLALEEMGPMPMIGTDDVFMLGEAIFDLPADKLEDFDDDAAWEFLDKVETRVPSTSPPIINKAQWTGIGKMVERTFGFPGDWESLEDRCCLQVFLDKSKRYAINQDVAGDCLCKMMHYGLEEEVETDLFLSEIDTGLNMAEWIDNISEELEERQKEGALDSLEDVNARRKRAAPATSCDTASVGGCDFLTTSEIDSMSNTSIMGCLYELGQYKVNNEDKAKMVLKKVKEGKGNRFDTLTSEEITDLNFIWEAALTEEILKNMSRFSRGTMDSVVAMLGSWEYDEDLRKALADKIENEWVKAKDMDAQQLQSIGQAACGLNDSSIEAIQKNVFKQAVNRLGGLDCSPEKFRVFATKALAAYGNTSTWDATTVNEFKKIISGLDPEKLMAIKPEAISGLSREGVESIPPKSMKAMKLEQIQALTASAAASVSEAQKREFSDEMLDALADITEYLDNSGPKGTTASVFVCLILTAATFIWSA